MRSKSLKLFLLILASFLFHTAKSQNDIINTIKGEKIICTITKEDSAKVYFKVGGNMSTVEASIERSQIASIQYAPKKSPELPTLIMNPAQSQSQKEDYVPETSTISTIAPPKDLPKKINNLYLCVGISSPTGKFNSPSLDTNSIGPAIQGQMVAMGFTHLVKKNFGFSLNGFYSNNELNTAPITQKYKYNTDSTWKADKAYWKSFGISFSLLYFKQINDFSFFAKVNAGYLSLKYPELKLSMHSDNYRTFQPATSDALSYGGGIGVGYEILEDLNAIFEVNYLQATCKYSEILIQGEEPGIPVSKKISMTKRDVKQTYQNVFISLGLNYWF